MNNSSFYITLPSNEISPEYPNNKIAYYSTSLPHPLNLEGEWELALVDFYYPHTWYNVDSEDATFTVGRYRLENDLTDQPQNLKWTALRRDGLNLKMTTNTVRISEGFYGSGKALVEEINDKIQDTSIKLLWNDRNNFTTALLSLPSYIQFSPTLSNKLGFHDEKIHTYDTREFTARDCTDLEFNTHNLYIYSNIVKESYVGNLRAPILATVATRGRDSGLGVTAIIRTRHYLPLRSNYVNVIEISIRNNEKELVRFQSGIVLVKLHFRRRDVVNRR